MPQAAATDPALEAKRKAQMQNCFKKFVAQVKNGCRKQICFNKFCKKNVFSKSPPCLLAGKSTTQFANDQELIKYALATI